MFYSKAVIHQNKTSADRLNGWSFVFTLLLHGGNWQIHTLQGGRKVTALLSSHLWLTDSCIWTLPDPCTKTRMQFYLFHGQHTFSLNGLLHTTVHEKHGMEKKDSHLQCNYAQLLDNNRCLQGGSQEPPSVPIVLPEVQLISWEVNHQETLQHGFWLCADKQKLSRPPP